MAALKAEFNFIDPLKTFHCPTFSCFGSVSWASVHLILAGDQNLVATGFVSPFSETILSKWLNHILFFRLCADCDREIVGCLCRTDCDYGTMCAKQSSRGKNGLSASVISTTAVADWCLGCQRECSKLGTGPPRVWSLSYIWPKPMFCDFYD
jgi:hypothetical protein